MSAEIALLSIAAAISAGVGWNTVGIWRAYRENKAHSIDWKKFRKNCIIGTIVGAIGYGISLSTPDPITVTFTIESFVTAVGAYFPIIVLAERIFTNSNKA